MANSINPAVLIPIYKAKINHYEAISLARALDCFRNYPIVLFGPQNLHPLKIKKYTQNIHVDSVNYEYWGLPNNFFSSVNAYNSLLLSKQFYSQLVHFSHILIYQLDAFVFEDRLVDWCQTDYDYVGAPIYPIGTSYGQQNIQCIGVGGFSLRKVNSFLKVLNSDKTIFRLNDLLQILRPYNCKGKIVRGIQGLRVILLQENHCESKSNSLITMGINEDVVYGLYCNKYYNFFLVPKYNDAIKFCIDRYVAQELTHLKGQLPFGTHAWWTIEENFQIWKPLIEKYGYTVNERLINI